MAREYLVTVGLHQQTVAGAVTLGVQHEHVYELTATAPATVTLDGFPGAQVAIVWAGAAGTVNGQAVADGETWVALSLSSGWRMYSVGNPVPGDEENPVPGTLSASSITDTGFTLTVTGASDDTGLHSTPYRFSTDNGATWSGWQASEVFAVTGKAASTTYQCRHEVRDASGKSATGTTVPVTTSSVDQYPDWDGYDTFTAPDSTPVTGRATEKGGLTWGGDSSSLASGLAASITGNALASTGGDTDARGASVPLSFASVEAEIDYDVSTGSAAADARRAYLGVLGVNSNNTLSAQVRASGSLIVAKGSSVAITMAGVTSGIPLSGTLGVKAIVSGSNVVLTVTHGAGTATATIPLDSNIDGTGRALAVAARSGGSKIDAVRWRAV